MILFSAVSFAAVLGIFYFCLLLLSCINRSMPENDPCQKFVELHLGFLRRLPIFIRLLVPVALTTLLWVWCHPVLARLQIATPCPAWHLAWQGALIGLALYLKMRFFLIAILVLYLINSYVYMGDWALWSFVDATAGNLLRPLRWNGFPLIFWRIDAAPALAIALLIECPMWIGWFAARHGAGLSALYQKLAL